VNSDAQRSRCRDQARLRHLVVGTGGVGALAVVAAVLSSSLRWSGLVTSLIIVAVATLAAQAGYFFALLKVQS
jgi:hypothetical protein